MIENNLLASVALFRKLYDREDYNNIYDILAEFIRGGVIYESKLTYTSEEIKGLLKKVYGFEIPESVIKTTLRNRFDGKLTKVSNSYTFQPNIKDNFDKIEQELVEVNNKNEDLVNHLNQYISKLLGKTLTEDEKSRIFENFTHFTMDNGYTDQYSELIGAFVVSNQNDVDFTNNLNSIREGIILYQGLSYTANLNELGKWDTDLDIYLAPEHLFNALGYNGILFEEIFDDFYKLVNDINRSNKPSHKNRERKIRLFYAHETKLEIDSFFFVAEKIITGRITIDPSKIAMETIVKGANTVSDIKTKQVSFYNRLKLKGIVEDDIEFDATKHSKYNLVDQGVIKEVEIESKNYKRPFDEDFCYNQLVLFSKINYKRLGKNNVSFEKVSDIYITENAVSKRLARSIAVKFGKDDITFAKDIDFAISRFWFKLKKGFNVNNHVPKSFDLINKAKIILSSYTNNSIAREYFKVSKQYKEGLLNKEDVVRLNIELREKNNVPEDINAQNIEETLSFLKDENFIENLKRENERKHTRLVDLETKLAVYERNDDEKAKVKLEQETNKIRLALANKAWNAYLNNGFEASRYFGFILFLNLLLASLAIIFTFHQTSKTWLMKFESGQIVVIVLYILFILLEVFGSKYIFNKSKILAGYNWVINIFSLKQLKDKFINNAIEEQKSTLS
jgi:hypothetical protein